MIRKILLGALAALVVSGSAAFGQAMPGAGEVMGNSTAAARPARAETVTAILDRAFSSAPGALIQRGASWGVLAPTATARQMFQSGANAAGAWSTTTWPATTTINRLLWSSGANVISDLATANSSILVTDGSGVPSLSTTLPAFTLGGTVSGGGNQINNVIIGNSSPLAGSFTALAYSTTFTGISTNSACMSIGRQGATNPVIQVDCSVASQATGIVVTGRAAGAGASVAVISSGTNENLTIDSKGSGTVSINTTGTGQINLQRNTAIAGTGTVTSASAAAFAVGPVGATNPALNVDASTASSATGLNIKSAAAGGGVAVSVSSSGANENLSLNSKGSGSISIGNVSTGNVDFGVAVTIHSSSATAFAVGPNAGTNPGLQVDSSTASSATGVRIKSAAVAGGVILSAISSGANENFFVDAKGSGIVNIGGTSTGGIVLGAGGGSVVVGSGAVPVATTLASGTLALATSAIASGACTSAQTASATGTATTDVIDISFNGDPTAVTGYQPGAMLSIVPYPTVNTVNVKVCNNTASSITPGAITLNWKVRR